MQDDVDRRASEILAAPSARDWLDAQASFDWPSAGLPRFSDWDQALTAVMRLIASAPSPMALMIGRRGILAANGSAQQLFSGKIGTAVNGRSVLDVLPDRASFYASILDRAFAGEGMSFRGQPIHSTDGGAEETNWFNLDFVPVIGSSGSALAVLGIGSDITEHLEAIGRLSESEARLRFALDGSGMVGIWTLDVATNTSTADANVARTYGLSAIDCRDGVDDDLFVQAIHPDDRERVGAELARAIATRSAYRCRYRILTRDHNLRWVITSAKPSLDEHGNVLRLLGVVVDVTGQVETASALAESRFQFQTLTETLPQIVWSCDAEGKHDYFSRRWSEFTGINPEDITENTWKELVYPDHWPIVSNVWDNARKSGKPYDIDYRFKHRSGEFRWLRVMALPMHDQDGRITRWFGTSTDVHDAYLMAEERERLAHELERIATEDQLTQVLTRRAFLKQASEILDGARQSGKPASLLMLDIDHFKSINDTYGHPAGDRVLAIMAQRIGASLKKTDIVGRLGGEEFGILLPACTQRRAKQVAERIRRSMAGSPVQLTDGSQIIVTISIGVTTSSIAQLTLDQLLLVADKALYAAKHLGRNRIAFAAT